MNQDELRGVFDRMASGYDSKQAKMAPIYEGLYFAVESAMSDLPHDALILCVGVGTGTELIRLAQTFPGWRFTAVEPSGPMLDVCRQRTAEAGVSSRCTFHQGYVETLPTAPLHDAATCFLVSQFILDAEARSTFFRQISDRLVPGGLLANADLSADTTAAGYDVVLALWHRMMSGSAVSAEELARVKSGYAKDVAILAPDEVASIIEAGGFYAPVRFFQAGLMHAWLARGTN